MTSKVALYYFLGVGGFYFLSIGLGFEIRAFLNKEKLHIVEHVIYLGNILGATLGIIIFLIPAIKASVEIYNEDFNVECGIIESNKRNDSGEWIVFIMADNAYYKIEDRKKNYRRGEYVMVYIVPETQEIYKMEALLND
ncbi:hypothetical protein [Lachnobacterium bovis]|uniref:Uncharacterized protein n=1 Tax=Lachnobacterium bovis DSM 14045 TaxID=1122142 RepID=A0A1H3FXS8_9FIRM|nr:hypothetical protein [Lachnobacterium bovis]SDX95645.1 hypothetical protein SAMN02910414_00420 [Lachnobacterium bovis DSM 14045]